MPALPCNRIVKADAGEDELMMKLNRAVLGVATAVLAVAWASGALSSEGSPEKEAEWRRMEVGWVIGTDPTQTAVILHTKNGGKTWTVQGDGTRWVGYTGYDISAVDGRTAWAALGGISDGKILHTTDGGKTWTEQAIPGGLGPMKQIRGLSRRIAWAASLDGTVLHTTDGGQTWNVVPHPEAPVTQVNRMDVRGLRNADIRIVDEKGGRLGMIHSRDNGATWRQETVDYSPGPPQIPGLHMVAAHSRRIAWCTSWDSAELFRTDDGATWTSLGTFSGPNDIDDMASPTGHTLWAVQNLSGNSGGAIFHLRLKKNGDLAVRRYDPTHQHIFEGLSCSDDRHAVVVGSRAMGVPTTVPMGVILKTSDGGKHWKNQAVPVSDVAFWKVSFVGAWR